MTARKGLLSVLAGILIIFSMMIILASPVHADDETYTITFSPGSIGGKSVTIRSTDPGAIAENVHMAEPGQFFWMENSMCYKLDSAEIYFKVPEGYYLYNWNCPGVTILDFGTLGRIVELRQNSVTMTASWADWNGVNKEVTIDPGEIGGDPVTVKSTDEGRIAGNSSDADWNDGGQFYPKVYDDICEYYYMPGIGGKYFSVSDGYRFYRWYCNETDKYYGDLSGVPISGDSITLTAQWEYVDEEVTIDGIQYYLDRRNGGKATVRGYDDSLPADVTIPETITYGGKEYTVTNIRKDAFRCCGKLQTVKIPESVENIGPGAFYVCSSLQSIVIPGNVKRIEELAFGECSNLQSITIPVSVTKIDEGAFNLCDKLTTIYYDGTEEEWNKISKAGVMIPENAEIKYFKHVTAALSSESMEYNGSVQKPEISVDAGGSALTEGTDYTLEWSDDNSVNAGTYTVTIKGIGDYSYFETTAEYTITAKKITPAVTLSPAGYVYNGKVKTPAVTVKAGSAKAVKDIDYTVAYASGRKNVGKYKVTVKMKGNYIGTKTATFRIVPGKAGIRSTKAGKGKVKVTMSKKAGAIGGKYYQIKYRVKGKSSWKTAKTTSKAKTVEGLKKGKKYQIKVRTFKKVGGSTYYGKWSKVKLTKKIK